MANDDVKMIEKATGTGKLESMNIEIADGGFLVSCTYKQKKSTKANEPVPWEPPKKKVFSSVDDLKAFLDDALGGAKGNPGNEDEGY